MQVSFDPIHCTLQIRVNFNKDSFSRVDPLNSGDTHLHLSLSLSLSVSGEY